MLVVTTAGCGSARWSAPAESRTGEGAGQAITGPSYRVRSGDTLQTIAWRAKVDYRRIAEWNRLPSVDRIYVGQVLRLTPPAEHGRRSPDPATTAPSGRAPDGAPAVAESRLVSARPSSVAAAGEHRLRWQWPTSGRVVQRFAASDPARKGMKIGGKSGQPVLAAEGGQVVYSGSGLVGYGPLIIVKHSERYLSAYGHNRKLLVQQGDQVTRGTQIAEMGLAGGAPLLYFEIRRDGEPVDPLALLPPR